MKPVLVTAVALSVVGPQTPRRPCPVTAPVEGTAPSDPRADPVRGYWHKSADGKLWAPASQPGRVSNGVGGYWVRPAGTHLTFSLRRLDAPGLRITSEEGAGYDSGFFYGGPGTPSEGCWEVTATAGTSTVTFVTEVHYAFDIFVYRPATRVTWSKEVGRLDARDTHMIVTAAVFEDPDTLTRTLRGVKVHLSDSAASGDFYMEDARLEGTGPALERWAGGALPMIYGLDRRYGARGEAMSLLINDQEHRFYFFDDKATANFAALLLKARAELRALSRSA
jgi:hypothetical protein